MDIDQSFEGMLVDRTNIRLELDEGILLHEQKTEEQTVLIQKIQERQSLLDNTVNETHQQSLRLTEFRIQREKFEEQLRQITEQNPVAILAEIDVESTNHNKWSRNCAHLNYV